MFSCTHRYSVSFATALILFHFLFIEHLEKCFCILSATMPAVHWFWPVLRKKLYQWPYGDSADLWCASRFWMNVKTVVIGESSEGKEIQIKASQSLSLTISLRLTNETESAKIRIRPEFYPKKIKYKIKQILNRTYSAFGLIGVIVIVLAAAIVDFIVCKMNTFVVVISCLALTAVAQPQGYVYNPPSSGVTLRLLPPSLAQHQGFGVRISIQLFCIAFGFILVFDYLFAKSICMTYFIVKCEWIVSKYLFLEIKLYFSVKTKNQTKKRKKQAKTGTIPWWNFELDRKLWCKIKSCLS